MQGTSRNPLSSTADAADGLIEQLMFCAARLGAAIEDDIQTKRQLSEVNKLLSAAENEIIMEAVYAADAKEGPLAGIAKTSSAYKTAIDVLVNTGRKNGGEAAYHAAEVSRYERQADNAAIEREVATVQFSAVRHAADLMAAILKTATI